MGPTPWMFRSSKGFLTTSLVVKLSVRLSPAFAKPLFGFDVITDALIISGTFLSIRTEVLSADVTLAMLLPARSITETEIETSCMLVMLSVTPTTTSQSLKLPETGLACLIDPPRLIAGTCRSSFDVNVRLRLSPTLANEELLSLSDTMMTSVR